MAEKICKVCFERKDESLFYQKDKTGRLDSVCKKCRIAGKLPEKDLTTKICKHCKIKKSVSEYQKAGGGKWLQPYCKPCDKIRKQKHRDSNIEYAIAKGKEYYRVNKLVIAGKAKEYFAKNKEDIANRSKIYRAANKDSIRKRDKAYSVKNAEVLKAKSRDRYLSNRDENLKKFKEYRDNRTPEQIKAKKEYDRLYKINNKKQYAEWREKNREKVRASKRAEQARRMCEPEYRLKKNLRSRLRIALKGITKSDTTQNILGCTIEFFKTYIESQFTEGMSWENYGMKGWHLDHKVPCVDFDLTLPEEQSKCFNYKNIQPLWWYDNLSKGTKKIEEWRKTA